MGNTLDKGIAHVGEDQAIVTNVGLSKVEATSINRLGLLDGSVGDSEVGGLEVLKVGVR